MRCGLWLMLVLLCFQYLPESARYLVAAGKKKEALTVLQKAAKMNRSTLPKGTLVDVHVVCVFLRAPDKRASGYGG